MPILGRTGANRVHVWNTSPFVRLYWSCMSRYTKANHRIDMRFELRQVWYVSFLEAGLQTELPRKLTFKAPGKILELARRGEAWANLESRQSLERAIEAGRGGCYLRLTPEQYARLRRR
jgi:hypothetical protein